MWGTEVEGDNRVGQEVCQSCQGLDPVTSCCPFPVSSETRVGAANADEMVLKEGKKRRKYLSKRGYVFSRSHFHFHCWFVGEQHCLCQEGCLGAARVGRIVGVSCSHCSRHTFTFMLVVLTWERMDLFIFLICNCSPNW